MRFYIINYVGWRLSAMKPDDSMKFKIHLDYMIEALMDNVVTRESIVVGSDAKLIKLFYTYVWRNSFESSFCLANSGVWQNECRLWGELLNLNCPIGQVQWCRCGRLTHFDWNWIGTDARLSRLFLQNDDSPLLPKLQISSHFDSNKGKPTVVSAEVSVRQVFPSKIIL